MEKHARSSKYHGTSSASPVMTPLHVTAVVITWYSSTEHISMCMPVYL